MNETVIPSIDPIALPAPIWLMQFLSGLTFIFHVIPMNVVLGGGAVALFLAVRGTRGSQDMYVRLARRMASVLPVAIAMTITLGVPPLLFLQAMYGPLFYTSSVLMAWPWLSVIAILLVGYYGHYYFSLSKDYENPRTMIVGAVAVAAFFVIAFLYVSNMTLMVMPERFLGIQRSWTSGFLPFTGDSIFAPRFLHFITGAVSVGGLLAVFVGLLERSDAEFRAVAVRAGGFTFVGATIVQIATGIWFLLALRPRVMMLFMGQDRVATALFGVAVLLALVAVTLILVAVFGKKRPWVMIAGTACVGLTIIIMTVMRSIVREAYLGTRFVVAEQPVNPAWDVVALFLVLFVAGVVLVGWMIHAVVTRRGLAAS